MVKCVAFRVDFNETIGYGHLFRVINIAKYLLKNKLKIILISSDLKKLKNIEKFLDKRIIIEKNNDNKKSIVAILNKHSCSTLISDIAYKKNLMKKKFFENYNEYLRNSEIKTISFDDPEQLCSSDLSIIPYASKSVKILKLKKTKVLKGIKYSIIPKISKAKLKKKTNSLANKILVVIGGASNDHITRRILLALNKIKYPKIEARIFIGRNSKKNTIKKLMNNKNHKIILFNEFKNIIKLLSWSDFAIVGEGLIKYEVIATRTTGFFINNSKYSSITNEKLIHDFNSLNVLNFLHVSQLKNINKTSQIFYDYIFNKKLRLSNFKNSKKIKFNHSLNIIKKNIK
jgi:spore coat polysaccharide biosynthesis predicted glycosyltransferase SpsG